MQLTVDLRSIDHPALDGGGMIIVGGRVIRVPPAGAGHDLVELVGRYLGTEVTAEREAALAVRRSLLAAIVGVVAELHTELAAEAGLR